MSTPFQSSSQPWVSRTYWLQYRFIVDASFSSLKDRCLNQYLLPLTQNLGRNLGWEVPSLFQPLPTHSLLPWQPILETKIAPIYTIIQNKKVLNMAPRILRWWPLYKYSYNWKHGYWHQGSALLSVLYVLARLLHNQKFCTFFSVRYKVFFTFSFLIL